MCVRRLTTPPYDAAPPVAACCLAASNLLYLVAWRLASSMEKKEKSVAGHFAVKYTSETYGWTQTVNKEDYGVDEYRVHLAFGKE